MSATALQLSTSTAAMASRKLAQSFRSQRCGAGLPAATPVSQQLEDMASKHHQASTAVGSVCSTAALHSFTGAVHCGTSLSFANSAPQLLAATSNSEEHCVIAVAETLVRSKWPQVADAGALGRSLPGRVARMAGEVEASRKRRRS